MSIATWKGEYFGLMKQAVKSDKAAIEHAIKKWTGLLPENMKRHGVTHDKGDIHIQSLDGSDILDIDTNTCALCHIYFEDKCRKCPIDQCAHEDTEPFCVWLCKGNPRPMLSALKKALKKIEKK